MLTFSPLMFCLQEEERINPELETLLEAGVDEMSWDSVVSYFTNFDLHLGLIQVQNCYD